MPLRFFLLSVLLLFWSDSLISQVNCEEVSSTCQVDLSSDLPEGFKQKFVDLSGNGRMDILQWERGPSFAGELSYYPHGSGDFNSSRSVTIAEGFQDFSVSDNFTIGDLDDNLRPDVVFVRSGMFGSSLAIAYNLGDNEFEVTSVGPNIPFSDLDITLVDPIVADFDNDGDQDILYCSEECYLLWNEGSGVFTHEVDFCLPIGSESTFAPGLAADFDGDTHIDVVGTLTDRSNLRISSVSAIIISDIGPACNDCTVAVSLDAECIYDVGDVDNDGDLDLLAGYNQNIIGRELENTNSLRILLNSGNGDYVNRNLAEIDACSGEYLDASWADVDADGDLDIAICESFNGCKIFRNDGALFRVLFDLTPDVRSLTFGDYNHDGRMDICGAIRNDFNMSETYFSTIEDCGVNQLPSAPGGLDEQVFGGHGDVLLSWSAAIDPNQPNQALSYNISVEGPINVVSPLSGPNQGGRDIVALGNQSLNQEIRLWDLPSGEYEWKVQAVDHSWSGGAWSNSRQFEIDQCFDFEEIFLRESNGMSVSQCVDLVGDDYLEILGQSQNTAAFFALGEEGGIISTGFDAIGDVESRDLNGDNLMDIVVSGNSLLVLLNRGDGTFARNPIRISGEAKLGDIDQDGDVDIILSGSTLNELRILRNNGDGSFADPELILIGDRSETIVPLELFDGDGDGDLDILASGSPAIVVGFGRQVSLLYLENFGDTFRAIPLETGFCGSVAVGDIDYDGDKDIVAGLSSGCSIEQSFDPGILIFRNNSGTFVQESAEIAPCDDHFVDIKLGDFDQDGKLDVAAIVEGRNVETFSVESRGLILLRNECDEESCSFTEVYYHDHNVQSMAIGDADRDNDLDVYITTGFGSGLSLLENTSCFDNTPPTIPTNLRCETDEETGDLIFSWDQATDENQEDASLTYQIEIFSEENSLLISSGERHETSGVRKLVTFGAQCHNTSWRYRGDPNQSLCFTVQAIDHSYVASGISESYCCNGQICENAIPIICGSDTIGDLRDENLINRIDDYSFCNFDDQLTGFEQPELVYEITDFIASQEGDSSNIYIGLEEIDADEAGLDLFVFKNCADVDEESESEPECVAYVERFANDPPALITIKDVDPDARYYVIVDAKNSRNNFRLSVSCPDGCENDAPLQCDEVRRASTFSNGSAKISSYYSPIDSQYFSQYPAEDFKVQFTAHTTGFYSLTLDSLTEDLDLFVLDQCDPFRVMAYGIEFDTTSEELSLFLSEGQQISICVDGKQGNTSSFRLKVACCGGHGSSVFLSTGATDTLICKSAENDSLEFQNIRLEGSMYSYFLTDTFNRIIREISSPLSVDLLQRGFFRIYGVNHDTTLLYQIGDVISAINSKFCAIPSDNYVALAVDSSYFVVLDTTICLGSNLVICDSILDTAGDHTVICTTKMGCDSIIMVDLKIDTSQVTIEGNLMFCAGDSTRLTAEPDFATYLWSTEATTKSIVVQDPNTYSVTVTSENGCRDTATVEVIEVEELLPELGSDTILCFGEGIVLDPGSFDQYLWSTGDTTRTLEVIESGEYFVDVRDAFGCTGSDSVVVEIEEEIIVRIDTTICAGTQLTICDTLLSEAGMHTVVCRSRRDCDSMIIVNLSIDSIEVSIEGNLMFCAGDSTRLTAEPDFATYLWSTEATTKSIVVQDPNAYSVTVTSENGCRDTATVEVIEVEELLPELGSDTILCFGEGIVLDPGSFDQYLWSTGDTTRTLEVIESGEYFVDVRDAFGCSGRDSIVVEIEEEIIVRIDTTICLGMALQVCDSTLDEPGEYMITCQSQRGCDSIVLINLFVDSSQVTIVGSLVFCVDGSTTLVAEPDFASYSWSTEDFTKSIEVNQPGEYSVTVTSANGCTDTATVEVMQVDEFDFTLGEDTTLCAGEVLILAPGIFNSYDWSTGDSSQQIIVVEAGVYSLRVEDQEGCQGSDTIVVDVLAQPEATFTGATTICLGDELELLGEGGENCIWLGPEDLRLEDCALNLDLLESGDYTLIAANVSAGITCADTTLLTVTVVEPPELIVAQDTALCEGRGSIVLAVDDCDDCVCTWSPSFGLSDAGSCSPTVTPPNDADIMYVVEKVRGGVCRVTDSVFVEGLSYVPVRAINDHTVLRRGTEVTLDLLTHNDSLDQISEESEKIITLLDQSPLVRGIGGDFDNLIRLGADISAPLGLDTFNYLLTDLTCDDSNEGTVSVQIIMSDQAGICDPTQEPDGTCDLLPQEDLNQFNTRNMIIYDREGNQVWASSMYNNDWDGKYLNGPEVPTGAYYYVLRLGDSPNPNIDDVDIRGVVTIVRR